MTLRQTIRFCRAGDGTRIAVAECGEGPVLLRATTPIGAEETTEDLHDRLAVLGMRSMAGSLWHALAAILPSFTGTITQIPPIYSAIRISGERAYDLARAGEAVELSARTVRIDALNLISTPSADLTVLEMVCGKGTYVRSLVRDLAAALGAEGHVAALRRTGVGPFTIEDAITLADLDALKAEGRQMEALDPVHAAVSDLPVLDVTAEQAAHLRQGRAIVVPPRRVDALRALRQERWVGDRDCSHSVLALEGDEPVAIGDMQAGKLSPWRVFVSA